MRNGRDGCGSVVEEEAVPRDPDFVDERGCCGDVGVKLSEVLR